ncbi:MAG: hypothetical protein ACJ76I_01095 [Gaiellaceae bacterium]
MAHPASEGLIEDVTTVVEAAVTGLAQDPCTFERSETNSGGRREVIFKLTPSNPRAAQITVHVEDGVGLVDVMLGQGGFFEVRARRGTRFAASDMDEVRALICAAIRGRYKETIWLKGDEVVQSRASATVGTGTLPLRWKQLFTNPLRRSVRRDIDYEPYEPIGLRPLP